MARSQSRTDFICETLLTASSDARSSLGGMQTSGLIEGASAFVVDKNASYILRPSSTATPDGDKVIAALGGGRWVENQAGGGAGTDPVEVRSLADLPDPVAAVITLAADTRYEFIGEVNIGTNRFVLSDGTYIVGRAGVIVKSGGAAPFFTTPTSGTVTMERVTIDNRAAGNVIFIDGGDVDVLLTDVLFTNTTGSSGQVLTVGSVTPVTGGTIRLVNCSVDSSSIVFLIADASTLDALEVIGCTVSADATTGFIFNATSTVSRVFITELSYALATGATGITAVAGATIPSAIATANDFSGAVDAFGAFNNDAAALFSPIEVRGLNDLSGAGTSITLADDTTYEIIGLIDIGIQQITVGANNVVRGRGGTIQQSGSQAFFLGASATGEFRLEDITVNNLGTGTSINMSSSPANVTVINCVFLAGNTQINTDGDAAARLVILGSRFSPDAAGFGLFLTGFESVVVDGCTFDTANGIVVNAGSPNIVISASIFDVVAARTGVADGTVTAGRLVGNIFTGAGTLIGAAVITPKWVARGNIGFADF